MYYMYLACMIEYIYTYGTTYRPYSVLDVFYDVYFLAWLSGLFVASMRSVEAQASRLEMIYT